MSAVPVLAVDNLSVEFRTRGGIVKALEQVTFSVNKGEMVAIVGESGSGKSVTAFTVMGILDAAGRVSQGTASFGGLDVLQASEAVMRDIRGREMSMIFQNPRVALNPIRRVGDQIADVLLQHGNVTRREAPKRAIEMLTRVRIPDPERRAKAYPFELSGGMCQRIMIAIALSCAPKLLIADEPTTGLDVTTQAAIMDLIAELGAEQGMSTLLITHDLGMAAEYCDQIVVMHAGHIVEMAPTAELFAHPRHPYTAKLIAATPKPTARLMDLAAIPGNLPDLRAAEIPPCRYSARCERRQSRCDQALPYVLGEQKGSMVACWNPL
ncbi:ABC transporter ATP-binding protein [Ferrovibrio terrae]|uniref:ABC transporter ATP-binding protein n=1 Tax=Ferrovibrio terrae TaxID=2594003 RepID=UPI003137DB15